ncbi:Bola1 [Symbiodinium sp. CCMP2456]|nr:Bola1 [Symbiodinium sp. CCMP2456]
MYCHAGRLYDCGTKPEATCHDFQAPDPCATTTGTTTTATTTTTSTTTTTTTSTSTTTTTTTSTTTTETFMLQTSWPLSEAVVEYVCLTTFQDKELIGNKCLGIEEQRFTFQDGQLKTLDDKCVTAVAFSKALRQNELNQTLRDESSALDAVLQDCTGLQEQRVTFHPDGTIHLEMQDSLCLDWDVYGLFRINNVYFYTCNEQQNEVWAKIRPAAAVFVTSYPSRVDNTHCLSFQGEEVKAVPQGADCPKWQWDVETSALVLGDACLTVSDFPELMDATETARNLAKEDATLQDCDGSEAQKFIYHAGGTIQTRGQDLCLDWDVAGIFIKDNVYFSTCNLQDNQVWAPVEDA